jgi:ATP-dependent RNA helicase DDX55/SPB4
MTEGKRFAELGLSDETLDIIEKRLGFDRATPVQEATIPLFSGHKDVSVDACTGSGKTLAFVVPIIEKLRKFPKPLKKHQVAAVVISPTRELSKQIMDVASAFIDSISWASLSLLVGGRYVFDMMVVISTQMFICI